MAEAKLKIQVAVEAGIHTALLEFAQHVFDEYGLRIDDVEFDWMDRSTIGGANRSIACSTRVDSIKFKQPL